MFFLIIPEDSHIHPKRKMAMLATGDLRPFSALKSVLAEMVTWRATSSGSPEVQDGARRSTVDAPCPGAVADP